MQLGLYSEIDKATGHFAPGRENIIQQLMCGEMNFAERMINISSQCPFCSSSSVAVWCGRVILRRQVSITCVDQSPTGLLLAS